MQNLLIRNMEKVRFAITLLKVEVVWIRQYIKFAYVFCIPWNAWQTFANLILFQNLWLLKVHTYSYSCLVKARVACPKFGHPIRTLAYHNKVLIFWEGNFFFEIFWMNYQLWNCFSFRMVMYYFRSLPSTKRVNLKWRS